MKFSGGINSETIILDFMSILPNKMNLKFMVFYFMFK